MVALPAALTFSSPAQLENGPKEPIDSKPWVLTPPGGHLELKLVTNKWTRGYRYSSMWVQVSVRHNHVRRGPVYIIKKLLVGKTGQNLWKTGSFYSLPTPSLHLWNLAAPGTHCTKFTNEEQSGLTLKWWGIFHFCTSLLFFSPFLVKSPHL